MAQDIVIRVLLLPIALLYGLAVTVRNALYRSGVLRSVSFDLPVISVGNLSVGGAGKSPHIAWLAAWLHEYINPAVLSRGYGRDTFGYRNVSLADTAREAGDEPIQFKRRFPAIPTCVSESRALGIPELLRNYPDTQCVLLDDAFQHLAVKPGLNILLTEYSRPFTRDWLLPAGRLREWRNAYRRADLIIVTKCPGDLSQSQRVAMTREIDPYPKQKIFFSTYDYGRMYRLGHPDQLAPERDYIDTEALLISAIANTDFLLRHLANEFKAVQTLEFEDHHYYAAEDILELKRRFSFLTGPSKMIVTTEKDATRLELHQELIALHGLEIWVLPIAVRFLDDDEAAFKREIQAFLLGFKA
ncbi:MAG: tetraacyldisaccharide 4'-kinase [Saprospiraceae bacterium]